MYRNITYNMWIKNFGRICFTLWCYGGSTIKTSRCYYYGKNKYGWIWHGVNEYIYELCFQRSDKSEYVFNYMYVYFFVELPMFIVIMERWLIHMIKEKIMVIKDMLLVEVQVEVQLQLLLECVLRKYSIFHLWYGHFMLICEKE